MGVLGPRTLWVYNSDGGNQYAMPHRNEDAIATAMTPTVKGALPMKPSQLKPRGVWAQNGSQRRFFVCGAANATPYVNGGTLAADGGSWDVTGRHGERTFGDGATL